VLDEHIASLQEKIKTGRRIDSIRGQEAVRVSTAIELGPGDLVSDSQVGVVMDLLAGAKVGFLLKRALEIHSGKKGKGAKHGGVSGRTLPWIENAGERLRMAMGAAATAKTLAQKNVVVAYVRHGEIAKGEWRKMLGLASKLELPLIFVVLPAAKGKGRGDVTNLSAKSAGWGVPGIPVDADDAVALYRAAQEAMGRTRGGDGPVLIECVTYRVKGAKQRASADPLIQMKEFLLNRKVSTSVWLEGAGGGMRRRIAAAK